MQCFLVLQSSLRLFAALSSARFQTHCQLSEGSVAAQQQKRTGRQDSSGAVRQRSDPPSAPKLPARPFSQSVAQSASTGTQTVHVHPPLFSQ